MENQIIISAVANGFVVNLPMSFNPYAGMRAEVITAMQMKDPLLAQIERNQEPKVETKKAPNIYIFDSWEKVLAFLSKQEF